MMKKIFKYLLITIISLCSQALLSQNEGNSTNRFSLGIIFTPQFSNWYYKTTPEDQFVVDYMDSVLTNKNGFSAGIIMEYDLNFKFSLKTGFQSSYYPYESIILEINNYDDPLFPCGRYSYTGSDHFIDLPILLKYNLYKTNRIKLFLSAGLINKFLFYNRTESYSECLGSGNRELISKSGNITNSFNYFIAASIEAGIDFSITDKIYTGLYPSFEYSFLNST